MTAALVGVLAYFALGMLGLVLARGRETALLAIVVGTISLALWAPGFPEGLVGGPPWGIAVAGDLWSLGLWSLALFLHLAVLLHTWSRDSLSHSLITLLVGTCLAGSISRDLFNLYVVLELSSLLSVILVAKEGRSAALWAALRYLLLAGVGMTLYLFGLGLVYGRTGSLSVSALAQSAVFDAPVRIGAGLLLAGAAVKTGVFLLGLWLPQAHGQAPTEVSVLLSGLVVKLGVLTLARLAEAFPVGTVLLLLGIVTGFGGLAYALWEKDLKVFLGFHTVSQLGYMLIGLGLGVEMGAILYAVAHGMFKGLLFLAAGEVVERVGRRGIADLADQLSFPVAFGLAVGTWAIAGLPPLAGFVAKNVIIQSAPGWAKTVLLFLGMGTAASFAKLIPLFQPRGRGRAGGVWLLSAAVIMFGLGGIVANPRLFGWPAWGEAILAAGGGYALYLGLRTVRPGLPRFTFDRALVSILAGAVVLAGLIALS